MTESLTFVMVIILQKMHESSFANGTQYLCQFFILTGDQNRALPLNFLTVVGRTISLMKDRADVCMLLLLDLEKVAGLSFLYSETSYWVDLFYNLF